MGFSDSSAGESSTNEAPEVAAVKPPANKTYKCPDCDSVFSRPYRLKNHISTQHEGLRMYKCDYEDCTKSFSSQSHLKRHEVTVHLDEEGAETCQVICEVPECGLVFANKYSLKKHTSRWHNKARFECTICKEVFRRKSQLNLHRCEVHNETAPYECVECQKQFVENHLYKKHMRNHKTYPCDCGETFKRWSDYLKHKKTNCSCPKAEYTCTICLKTFHVKSNLTQHSLHVHISDSQIESFKCAYLNCGRSFKYKKNLRSHIKSFHEKLVDYFECTAKDCKVVLKSKKGLKQHLRQCHSDKPLKPKLRKPRKDRGTKKSSKTSTAVELSGLKPTDVDKDVSFVEVDNSKVLVFDFPELNVN